MRGRLWAVLITMISFSLPVMFWIGSAVVALVTLRQNSREGGFLLLCALASIAIVSWSSGQQQPEALLCVMGAFICAQVLRTTASWSITLLVFIPVVILMNVFAIDHYEQQVNEVLRIIKQEFGSLVSLYPDGNAGTEAQITELLKKSMLKSVSFVMSITVIIALVLARYWQAALYNPGGFGNEFRQLRFNFSVVMILACCLFLLSQLTIDMKLFAAIQPVVLIPLVLTGTAIIHSIVKFKQMSVGWLVLYYILMIVAYPLMVSIAVLLCCIDSAVNIRSKLTTSKQD